MYAVTPHQMAALDKETINNYKIPGIILMENATIKAWDCLKHYFKHWHKANYSIVCGGGNNGGDGFAMARHISRMGLSVNVFSLKAQETFKGDALTNLNILHKLDIPVFYCHEESLWKKNRDIIKDSDIIIDAILGTGLNSLVKDLFYNVIEYLNNLVKPIFSIDIPSGIDGASGKIMGISIRAVATVTFGLPKTGLLLFPGADMTGDLICVDIGIPEKAVTDLQPLIKIISPKELTKVIIPRNRDAHKGTFGHLLIIGGAPGKTGAPVMTALGAIKVGTGLVTAGIPDSLHHIMEIKLTEAMTVSLSETHEGFIAEQDEELIKNILLNKNAAVIGPGLGTASETGSFIRHLVMNFKKPMLIDADALNLLSKDISCLDKSAGPRILTPHPGEMARLSGTDIQDIESDRIGAAKNFAKRYNIFIVLKGARSIIAFPSGRVFINPHASAAMSSGGMGDVLSGIIGGFLAQGYGPEKACLLGVYLHGLACEILTGQDKKQNIDINLTGQKLFLPANRSQKIGVLATELAMALPLAMDQLKRII